MRGSILVVDDETGPRESLRMILKKEHDVRTATCGEDALVEVDREVPDLVFLDLRMPGMHGTEVLQAIKEKHPEVEVAVITAYAGVDSARLAVRYGAIDYLTKPYSVDSVEAIVEKALGARRQQHDAAILAAQLAKMSESLSQRTRALAEPERVSVADAMEKVQSAQSALREDLDTVDTLSELGEVAAEVTHDINNLLTVVLTNSQYLLMQIDAQQATDADAVTQRVSRIVRAAEDCSTIIRRIKDFVRLNVNHRPCLLDINALVESAADLTREKRSATGKPIDFRLNLRPVLPVYGDEVALRTVLVNMIENSADALDDGFVELSTDFSKGHVHICVRDNGKGMSPEILANATEAFFSANKPHGTGLGLSTADRVIKRHEGKLSLESEEGVGTTVRIELPVSSGQTACKSPAGPVAQAPNTEPAPGAPVASAPAIQGKIVLVDDEESIRELMASVLELDGHTVLQACDGVDGWKAFQKAYEERGPEPLLVITDQEMPRATGRDLAEKIKRTDGSVPVLMVSGYMVSGGPEPADALLSKPFGIDDLLDRVRELLDAAP